MNRCRLNPFIKTMLTDRKKRKYVMQQPTVFFGEPMRYGQAWGCFGFMVLFMLISIISVGVTWNLFKKIREKTKNHCDHTQYQAGNRNYHWNPTVFVVKLKHINIKN